MIAAAKETIKTTDAVLNLYNQIVDQIGQTEEFKQTASYIGELKTSIINGIDVYSKTPKTVFEWCDTATSLLTTYLDQKATAASTQKQILIKSLDDGETIMRSAQHGFHASSSSFNDAVGKLLTVENQLANHYHENHTLFESETMKKLVADMKEKIASIGEFFDGFFCIKDQIKNALNRISDFKVQTEETRAYLMLSDIPEIEDIVKQSAANFITKCHEYRKKYE